MTFLDGQICMVTGGAQGVGWALTQALADQGATVYTCDVADAYLDAARTELDSLPWKDRIHLSRCDVTDREAVAEWINQVHQAQGRIDVLVNNATYARWVDVVDMSLEDADRIMKVSYYGMLNTTNAVLPLMLQAGQGQIINLGSSGGKVLIGGVSAAYAAAKAALDAYTQTLHVELKGSGVTMTIVRPSTIAGTHFFKDSVESSRMPRLSDFIPYLTPPDVANRIIKAIRRREHSVNVPGYIWTFFVMFEIMPRFFQWFASLGGGGKRDYGQIDWKYSAKG